MSRAHLDERIAARVRGMWERGLVSEVRHLESRGLREGRTASRALGYAQALAEIDGALSTQEAQEQTTALTRRFARRQESWFTPDPRISWLDALAPDVSEQAVAQVRAAIGDNGGHG
jgi:tRNA dimethylallyltransferase